MLRRIRFNRPRNNCGCLILANRILTGSGFRDFRSQSIISQQVAHMMQESERSLLGVPLTALSSVTFISSSAVGGVAAGPAWAAVHGGDHG
jgi:hypothetical protein